MWKKPVSSSNQFVVCNWSVSAHVGLQHFQPVGAEACGIRDEENAEQELSSRLSFNKQQVFRTKGNCITGSGMVRCVFADVYDELSRGISPAVLQ